MRKRKIHALFIGCVGLNLHYVLIKSINASVYGFSSLQGSMYLDLF